MSGFTVRMGSLTMNNEPDANGDVFRIEDVENLWGAEPDMQTTQLDNIGERVDGYRYKGLGLVVKGWAFPNAAGDTEIFRIRRKLVVNSFTGGEGTLYVDEPEPGMQVQLRVRRGGEIDLPAPEGARAQRFEIPLFAADPRKYAQLETVWEDGTYGIGGPGGQTAFYNLGNGNAPTPLRATIGNQNNTDPWLEMPGQGRLTVAGSFPNNSYVDFGLKRTFRSPAGFGEYAARPRVWWELPAGGGIVQASVSEWSFRYRAAYL